MPAKPKRRNKTKKPKRNKTYWVVYASYPLDSHVWGSLDDKLEKAVGYHSDGAGTGFGYRDIDWSFATKEGAEAALKALKSLKIKSLKLDMQDYKHG